MTKIFNQEQVTNIIMRPHACVKCQIGQDWYPCEFEVKFEPSDYYPDYMEIEQFVKDEIDGHELNIEQAAKRLYDFLINYEPRHLIVINHVQNCKTHFNVDVQIG